jgi:hypothetical protein
MTKYAIVRDYKIVNQVVFLGKGLYRPADIVPLLFETHKKADEVATVLGGVVVDYDEYMSVNIAMAA